MVRTRLLAAASLAAIALTACRDTATDPQGTPAYSQDEQGYLGAHVHKMPIKSQAQEAHAAKPNRPGSGTGISYHGGAILPATSVVAIYWALSPIYTNGPTPGTAGGSCVDNSLVGYFLSNLSGSSYFNINTTYSNGSGTAVGNTVLYRGCVADNTNVPVDGENVSDARIQAVINRAMATYGNDGHTIYAVFSAGTVNLGGGFGTQYCAYHGDFTASDRSTALFAVQPYNYAYPSACTMGYPAANGDPGADAEVNTLAHEIEEAATDPHLNAWYDQRGYENADKCAWTFGSTFTGRGGGTANITVGSKDFLVQQNWINTGSGGCRKSYP